MIPPLIQEPVNKHKMAKPIERAYSRYSLEAAALLGQLIRQARIERKLTIAELAERAGISKALVQRIEQPMSPRSIGAAFEAAAIVGVRLFEADPPELSRRLAATEHTLTLLPKKVRQKTVKDDF
jgi:transcriptional regulator with XRE-family HTH domain